MFPNDKICLHDVTQAYKQGQGLQWDSYVKPADQFNLPNDKFLKNICTKSIT